jgi:ribonuclease P protein component
MAGGTVSRTPHFVLHRAPLAAPSDSSEASHPTTGVVAVARAGRARPLFPVVDAAWIGAVVPKRWAKRAVTRNGIRRQIYDVSASFASRLPAAAHVVRLRTEFARAQFPSAWSEPLKASVRRELLQLFERVAAGAGAPGPATDAATANARGPATGAAQASAVDPAQSGLQGCP